MLDLATSETIDVAADLDRDCHGDSVVWVGDAAVLALVDAEGRVGVRGSRADGGATEVVAGGDRRITASDVRAGRNAAVCSGPTDPPILVADVLTAASDPATVGATVAHDPNAAVRGARSLRAPAHPAVARTHSCQARRCERHRRPLRSSSRTAHPRLPAIGAW